MIISDKISGLRKERGMTQEQLGALVGQDGALELLFQFMQRQPDAETAHSVSEAILHLPEISSITVTHRLDESLLCQYDRIFVMKDGRLAKQGDFEELMKKRRLFYSLYTVANT
ncbi:MAG: hypothetical protein LUH12_11875 [Bacteroides sp.]|nr:hypothetical protein [Bacteroides sp.]